MMVYGQLTLLTFLENSIPGLDTLLTVIQIDEQSSVFIPLKGDIFFQIANEL